MKTIENIPTQVAKLSLQEQLLELLMLDIRYFSAPEEDGKLAPVTKLPAEIYDLLKEYPLGGVVLFRENLAQLDEIVELTHTLQKNARFGRLLAVDQEGGVVTRVQQAVEMPGNMALGAINDVLATSQASQILATELDALGFNFMFSPVLDVNNNPQNPIIGVRSFGKDPHLVARHGVAYCDGLNRVGLIGCGKHFPGHGDTASDSHHALPVINKSVAEFTQIDLHPFRAAIEAQIDSIMTAHIVFPNLDDEKIISAKTQQAMPTPATLSKKILTDLLRDELNFKGVIVSDALDMRAISDNFTPVEATLNCIAAGVDLVLMPIRLWSTENIQAFKQYVAEIVAGCEQSEYLQQRVFDSCCRIIELKQRKVLPKLLRQESLEQQVQAMRQIVYCEKHQAVERELAARAITLVNNAKAVLPWSSQSDEKILLVAANLAVAHDARYAFSQLGYPNVVIKTIDDSISAEDLAAADKALLLTYNLTTTSAQPFNNLINHLSAAAIPHVILSCRNPYDSLYLSDASTYLLSFGCSGIDQTNYSLREFKLNVSQALKKIMTARAISEFNHHSPV